MTMERKLRANLLKLFNRYALNQGLSYATVSGRVVGDGRFYDELKANQRRFSIRRYDLAVARFSEIWPPLLEWPREIERIRLRDVPIAERKPRSDARRIAG